MESSVNPQASLQHPPAATDGPRKAAVLLASLPTEDAAFLLRQLDEKHLATIAKAAMDTPFRSDEQITVLRELSARHKQQGRFASGGADNRALCRTSRVASPAGQAREAFAPIKAASAATLVRLLANELPQTIAVVLAHIDPPLAAQVLEQLPSEKQLATSLRIADLGMPDPMALAQVANVLRMRFEEISSPPSSPIGGAAHLAQILQHTNSATEKALLANVGQENGALVKSVARHLSVLRHLKPTDAAPIRDKLPATSPVTPLSRSA